MTMNTKDLAKYLYDYAMANYEKSGWSVIVETMELADIEAWLTEAGATTKTAAKKAFVDVVDIWGERMADANYREEY